MKLLEDLLIKQEGYETHPYMDTKGKLTIGVGRNLVDHGLSDDEIKYLLKNDIDSAVKHSCLLPWFSELNEVRQAVVLSMIFNLGFEGFKSFKEMNYALEMHDYVRAADEMRNSLWAHQVGNREVELARMMESGVI